MIGFPLHIVGNDFRIYIGTHNWRPKRLTESTAAGRRNPYTYVAFVTRGTVEGKSVKIQEKKIGLAKEVFSEYSCLGD
jgi:SNF2 family DNA or RNA helicase